MSTPKTILKVAPGMHDFFIIREFDAPVKMVFSAFAEPSLYVQWFMPATLNLQAEKMDCITGGSYYLYYTGPGGMVFGFRGVYHEVMINQSIIKTSAFEGLPQKIDPVLEKTVFEELENDRCRVTIHTICPSADYRDNMIAANMEPTLQLTHTQLDRLLYSFKTSIKQS